MTPAGDAEGTPPDEPRGDDEVVEPAPSADPGESPAEAAASAAEDEQTTGEPEQASEAPEPEPQPAVGRESEDAVETAAPENERGEGASSAQEEPAAPAGQQQDAGADEAPPAREAAGEARGAAAERRRRAPRRRGEQREEAGEEVVPGAHLEPDLVLDEPQAGEDEFAHYAAEEEEPAAEEVPAAPAEPRAAAVPRTPMDLAVDARYRATGKRKSAVARVILRPGDGDYRINGRALDDFFPRETLRVTARQPLDAAGYSKRMDVVAKIHGGGVSSQAGALRHGIARALVEADPNLRAELKRRGFLTRDARVKERKKAGLKKARKRPQFSKR